MILAGFERFTLIDYPKKMACIIFLHGCNFRCSFCHNPELVIEKSEEKIDEEKIFDFLKKRSKKIEGVVISGGEPLITLKESFLRKIKELGYLIKLDTNGSFPEKLQDFIEKGLIDFVSMDIKSSPEKYEEVTQTKVNLKDIEKSIKIISKLKNYEFRTTIVKKYHNLEEIKKMVKWLNKITEKKPRTLVLQGFKNSGKLINPELKKEQNVQDEYLEELKKEIKHDFEEVVIRN